MSSKVSSAAIAVNPMLPAVLRLTLTKKWYDMILSGEKKEEYREVKDYWITRFQAKMVYESDWTMEPYLETKKFDFVEFKNGYSKSSPTMLVECKGITIGKPRPEWSEGFADDCFVISLGNVVKRGA